MAYLSQLNVNNNDYDLKDTEARNDLRSTQTVSGNPLTLTDCAPINAESLKVELSPKQDLHGQSAPYVGGAGNNILNVPQTSSTTLGNVTLSIDENGVCTLNGLCNQSNNFYINVNNPFANGESYSFCLFSEGTFPSNSYAKAEIFDNTVSNGILVLYNNSAADGIATKTIASDISSHSIVLRVRIDNGHNYQNCKLYPMLQKGIQASMSWAPWKNICPISGYTQTSVEDVGKNRMDFAGFLTASNQSFTENDSTFTIPLITNEVLGWYEFSDADIRIICSIDDMTGTANNPRIEFRQNGSLAGQAVNAANKQITITCSAFRMNYSSAGSVTVVKPMIRPASESDATFEPYASTSATIQFGQTVYGAEVDFGGGTDETKEKDILPNSWNVNAESNDYWILSQGFSGLKQVTNADTEIRVISDKLRGMSASECIASRTPYTIAVISGSRLYMILKKSDFATLSDVNTWVGAQNIEICYEVETPAHLSTPPTPLRLLKGINNLSADGVMQIGYQPDNVIGELKGMIQDLWDYILSQGE